MNRLLLITVAVIFTLGRLSASPGVEEDFLRCVMRGEYGRVASLLKQYPALVKTRASSGASALHFAVAYGKDKIAELLLRNGADINARDKYGLTPLHYATIKKQYSMIRWLLDKGADVNATDRSHCTPLFIAARNNDPIAARMLIARGASIAHQSEMGTALHEAAGWRSLAVVRVLLDAGAPVRVHAPHSGKTPLHDAAYSHALDVAQLLVKHGARIEDVDSNRCTPLHAACERGASPQFIRWILQSGANPSARDKEGNTPLHTLAQSYRELLDHEAILRRHGRISEIKRDRARYIRDVVESARVLLAHGADPSIKNLAGQTPIDVARRVGFAELVKLLQEHKQSRKQ